MDKNPSPRKNFNIEQLKRVLDYSMPYKHILFGSMLMSFVLAIVAPLRPMLIQLTLNKGIQSGNDAFFLSGPGAFILEITIIQIVILILESALRYYFTYTSAKIGQHVVKDLRMATYSKIINFNLSQFDKTPIGTLTTRTVNDIEAVNEIFSDGLIPIIADMLSIIAVLSYMFYTDWQITLICLAPFSLMIVATYYFKESVNKSFVIVRNSVAQLNAFVQEHISGMSVIQAFAAEETEKRKFNKINATHKNANIKAIFAYSVFFPFVELISAVSIGLLVWWAAQKSLHLDISQSQKTAGIVTSFILCLNLLFRPLRMIADKFNVLQMGIIASERVFKVIDNEDYMKIDHIDLQLSKATFNGEVEFDKVWFAYNDDQYVLKDISFKLPAGKTLAIVGHTGSGKTSIVSLINRLYHINQGKIKIDGIEIEKIDLETLRKQIAVVLQDVFLFSSSILDNITLMNPEITKSEVEYAAKMIDLHDFIMQLPGGYSFNIMERGATLSVGQRQLLSFVRAILYNPSILILDEATASVDTETEQLIQHAIDKIIAGRTSIIIAHRLSTIRKADYIMVLDKGEIKEMGSHQELLDKKGTYFELIEKAIV
jgi:ATP-binding cassette subfamily B protein